MYKISSPKYYQKTKNEEEKETKQQYGIKRYQNLPKYEKKKSGKTHDDDCDHYYHFFQHKHMFYRF